MKYPYNDDYMIFDEESNQYVLTEKCILESVGVDLTNKLNERNTVNSQVVVNRLLRIVSNQIYGYIHKFNANTFLQDKLIAKIPSLRKIIQHAMEEQFLYLSLKGDLSRSIDQDSRALAIDETAKTILERNVPEIGTSILYTGDLARWTYWISL